jgi:ribosomal protein S18 acetylase RimI-like enzyme
MLRDLTRSDEAALAAFFADNNLPAIVKEFHPFPLDAASARRLCTHTGRDRYFVFEESGSLFGFAMLRGWDEGFAIPSFGILVHREHAGHGIGRSLTAHALTIAKEMSAPRVRLTVHRENARAVRLYGQCGFRHTGTLADGRLVMIADL